MIGIGGEISGSEEGTYEKEYGRCENLC